MCGCKCTDFVVGCEELYKTLNVKFIVSFLIECFFQTKITLWRWDVVEGQMKYFSLSVYLFAIYYIFCGPKTYSE